VGRAGKLDEAAFLSGRDGEAVLLWFTTTNGDYPMTSLSKMLIVSVLGVCTGLFLPASSATPDARGAESRGQSTPGQVEIAGTQLLTIHSTITGQDYDLYVNIPRNYSDTTRRFPVFYLLDAQYDFPLVNSVYGEQYYDGFLPDIIIVGITWSGKNANYDSLRTRDLTPTKIKQIPYTGNGPKFLAFIKNELIPFIGSRYRVDRDDRGLMGSSLGGLFTLYAMFNETDLFSRYVLTSPAITWDDNVTRTYEENYHAKHTRLPARLFMAIGGLEGVDTTFERFTELLNSRHYEGLKMETKVLEGMGHSGGKAEGYARGLQWAFARTPKMLDPRALDAFTGKYRLNPQAAIDIIRDGDHLTVVIPNGQKIPLLAESDNGFFVKGIYLFLTFKRGAGGAVTGAHVEQYTEAFDLTRE
jgi:predicted alpha/beta superfamily hydrolase